MKILIVEDEPSLRELMQRTLEKERMLSRLPQLTVRLCKRSKITVMTAFYWILCCRTVAV